MTRMRAAWRIPNNSMEDRDCVEERIQSYTAEQDGERLDVFCAKMSGETRSSIQKLIEDGEIIVNGRAGKANLRIKNGDRIQISFPPPVELEAKPECIPISIIYQDSDIAVIDKAKGMVVHPAPGNENGTLVNALLHHLHDLSGIGGIMRPGIVHRIDKMTSGLIVIAKNDMAHQSLAAQIKEHSAGRTYIALAEGNIAQDCGTVNAPIGRSRKDRKKMAVVEDGREAITHWRVLARPRGFTLLEAKLETGRTHQIRVHMAYIGHPLAGDTVYGSAKAKLDLDGQALHACRLHLTHPRSGERMLFKAPIPPWFLNALEHTGDKSMSAAWIEAAIDTQGEER